jgi:hypothetical protein
MSPALEAASGAPAGGTALDQRQRRRPGSDEAEKVRSVKKQHRSGSMVTVIADQAGKPALSKVH